MTTTIEVYQAPEGAFTAEVAFRGDGWVNATQMAKAFGKKPETYLRTARAQEYLAELEKAKAQKCALVQKGGACPGTWMHPTLAMDFARSLSARFAVWCDETVRRLMSGGDGLGGPEIKALLALVADLKARVEQGEKVQRLAERSGQFEGNYRDQVIQLKRELAERDAAPKWEELERRQRGALKAWVQTALVKSDESGRIRSTALVAEAMKSMAAQGVVLPRPTYATRWLEEVIQEVFGLGKRHDIAFENGYGRGWKFLTWANAGTARIVNFSTSGAEAVS